MASWQEFEAAAPELAALARERLEAHTHLTLATLRRDGAPRISGTEMRIVDGDLYIGSMWQGVKALDLRRDGRFALHSGTGTEADPAGWPGDAKVAGVAEEIADPARILEITGSPDGRSHVFRLDLDEVVVVRLNARQDKLVIESWHAGRGVERIER
jgi:hypothetical protein